MNKMFNQLNNIPCARLMAKYIFKTKAYLLTCKAFVACAEV